jgi:anti-sigma regulatory factor (Ser/Thr protein kinase)
LLAGGLDQQGVGFFILTALPEAVHVQSQGGYEHVVETETLKRRARHEAARRRPQAEAESQTSPDMGQ